MLSAMNALHMVLYKKNIIITIIGAATVNSLFLPYVASQLGRWRWGACYCCHQL